MPGFISPMIVGYITTKNTAAEWQLVFWITAFVYGFGVIFFALTVSGDRQPWNDVDGDSRNTDTIESGDEPARSISMSPNSEAKLTDVRKLSSPKGGDGNDEKESSSKEEENTKAASPQSPKKETPAQDENKGDKQEEEKEEEEGVKKTGENEDEKTTPNNEEAEEATEEKKE